MKTRLLLLSFLTLTLSGCATHSPWVRNVASFGVSAPPALDKVSALYTSANDIHVLVEETKLADNYATNYTPGQLTVFLQDSDLQPRLQAIAALKGYASLVGDLAAGKRAAALTQAKSTQQNMQQKAASSSSKTTKSTLNQQELNLAFSGLDMALQRYIEHEIGKALPPLVANADPSVQKMCNLLSDDLQDLRVESQAEYRVLLMEQNQFVDKNRSKMSPTEQKTEVLKLFDIEREAAAYDKNLAGLQTTLQQIAVTHHRLAGSVK